MFGEYRRIIISLPCIGILVWEGEVHVRGVLKNNNFPALYRYFSMGGEVHVRGVLKNNNFPALYRYFSMGGRRACSGSTEE